MEGMKRVLPILQSMTFRDLRSRYAGSFLGVFWSVIHPVTQVLVYYFVFSVVLTIKLGGTYGNEHFGVWLIAGILPWLLFADVVGRSPKAVIDHGKIITKMVFPSELISIVYLLSGLVHHLIAMLCFIVLYLVMGGSLTVNLLFVLPLGLVLCLFTLGLSWMLSALNVYLRDISQVTGVVLMLYFFLNPIVYPADMVPASAQVLLKLNPMTHFVDAYRAVLLGTDAVSIKGLVGTTVLSLVLFLVGLRIFRKLKPGFADCL